MRWYNPDSISCYVDLEHLSYDSTWGEILLTILDFIRLGNRRFVRVTCPLIECQDDCHPEPGESHTTAAESSLEKGFLIVL